jgi:hypothetical protein
LTIYPFSKLGEADLLVDAVYQGGRRGNAGDDPLGPLLKVSNSGGFRYRGSMGQLDMLVLTTGMTDPDWPDRIDRETGIFTYFGDNKVPGQELHSTPRRGNEILRAIFENAHGGEATRYGVPPIFVFANTGQWRDVEFLGLVVPGTSALRASEDLVAVWHTSAEKRFQNYRATFTVLDAGRISREWLTDILHGEDVMRNAPLPWKLWRETGQYRALRSSRTLPWRTRVEQQPDDDDGRDMIAAIHSHFAGAPHRFEHFSARLVELLLPGSRDIDVTRASRDGGRDAVGKLQIGREESSIAVEFAIEAKCYAPSNSVGVREMSRLISRLRHRQFGVLVTTSHVDQQAYREIKEDQHPIIVIAGRDIVSLLRSNGRAEKKTLRRWLQLEFGPDGS